MESAAMPPEKAATTDELLRRLSGGWSFRVEPQRIAAQIASFVREVPLGLSDIMVQHPFKPLSDPGVRDFLAGSKADLDSFNESKNRFTNQINARDGRRGTWSLFIQMMGEIARGYAAALKREVTTALAQDAVTVAGRSDAPNVPTWTSSVLYLLFSLHRFTRSELVLLEACLDRPVGLLFVPFFQIKATLEAYQSWKRQKLEAADQYDVTRVACALPFVDVLVTDGSCGEFSPTFSCAVQRHGLSAGANPARQLLLQPVAIGAVVEVTKRLKPSVERVMLDDLASMQAVT